MPVFKIIALIIIVYALALLALGFVMFDVGIRRRRIFVKPGGGFSMEQSPQWAPYLPEIKAGMAWIRAHEGERVEIESYDGLRLRGRYIPAEGSKRTAILCHGYRSDAVTDFSCSCRLLHEAGFNLLLISQRAHGESEGRYIYYGVRERYDVQRWAEYIDARQGSAGDIFLGGMSMGSASVLMASNLPLPATVRGITADCGFTSPWDEFKYMLRRSYHMPARPLLDVTALMARLSIGFDFRETSTKEALAETNLPVLLVHGCEDVFVPTYMSEEAYAACRSEKELELFPGASHGMSYFADTERYKRVLMDFLERHSTAGK